MRPRKLVWTEGLFVTQHHFQQLDRYHEANVHTRLGEALAYPWGVSEIEFDERALATGQLKVTRMVGVLPDGSPVACGDGHDDTIAPRAIEGAFHPQLAALDVYIALAGENSAASNVELDNRSQALGRYVREQATVVDYNTGTQESGIQWARRNFRILLGDEKRESFDAIRVAQLVRLATGAVALKETYVPPVSTVTGSSFLVSSLRRLLGAMSAKYRSLADSRRQRSAAQIDFQASDTAKFWLMHTLGGKIPQLAHLVDHPRVHPETAFLVLSELVGQLSTFAAEADPTQLPKFNYLDLEATFAPLFERAQRLVDAVISERYVSIPLTRREDGMYLAKLDDPHLVRHEFFVAASGSVPEGQLRERLPKLAKVASWNQISSILNSAINGAKLELEYRPPGALPVKPGLIFFRMMRTPEYWNDISTTGTIAIYQPIEPQSVNLQLFAVDPTSL